MKQAVANAIAVLVFASAAGAQTDSGVLRITVSDQTALPLAATVDIFSTSNQVRRTLATDRDGKLTTRRLPFGVYRIRVAHQGFATFSEVIEIRSAVPVERSIVLNVAGMETAVVVNDEGTLIDPHRTGSENHIGSEALRNRRGTQPGRSVAELINNEPGWLLEANAVLHPRGSEYQTQYVVNGLPLTDNRSPAFAPELDAADVQSMNVLTSNYPAEYGRKLGGVIEVTTARDSRPGLHGKAVVSGGSFDTADAYAMAQYGWGRNTLSASGYGARTGRYLDPPVEQNYTNTGSSGGFAVHYDRDLSDATRIGVVLRREQARFLVPDEQLQYDAGQRQDRSSYETIGQFSYQRVLSPRWLADLRVMSRDLSADLWSNALSTPIIASQDRGFREAYFKGSLSAHLGRHDWKAGAEGDFASLREAFGYAISDPSAFDPATPAHFAFTARAQDREQSAFVQDLVRLGNFTVSAGVRYDHYRLIVAENAVSPRLGGAWYWRAAGLVLHGSWDRVFQTPASENLLLASSAAVETLADNVLRLPVRPSRGNFLEAGFSKGLRGAVRLDGNYYHRTLDNFADDDLLLNTGVSFPIAFRKGEIHGFEAKLDIARWGPVSGFVSYSNMLGVAYLPVTGGLFLGDQGTSLLASTDRFPITQDQRNSVRSRLRWQVLPRLWLAAGASYGSGLPVEFDGTRGDALAEYGERIVSRVNLERGRLRPSFSADISGGLDLAKRDQRALRFQADVLNLTDRLNVINFAGLFSGTAIGPPRGFSLRLAAEF